MSNACGQFGRLYSESGMCYNADGDGFNNNTGEVDISCEVDASLEMEAASHPKYNALTGTSAMPRDGKKYGPPPFYCGPKRSHQIYAGYWDGFSQEFVRDVAYPSALGKVDIEG